MDNQHREIKGYRELDSVEVNKINGIKELEKDVLEIVAQVYDWDSTDKRWANIAKTHVEEGFMALVRSIAKPE